MKNSIIISLLIISGTLQAQISFEGQAIPMDSLNSPNGQNYLVLDPANNRMAFTEERGGVGEFSIKDRLNTVFGTNWEISEFTDFLGKKGMHSPIGFQGDGLIYGETIYDKGVYTGKIWINANGVVEEVLIPYFKTKSPIISGCISADGRFMILSLESSQSAGVEDLYLTKKDVNGNWSRLQNLGRSINTNFQEITPFLAADNRTLFFATNGRGGEGSFDIFYSVRQDDYWRSWSEPVNLGSQINSTGAETSFVFRDGSEWAYFVSSRDSDGYGDIMRIKIKEEIEADTVVEDYPRLEEVIADEIILKIMDKKTREFLSAELILDTTRLYVPEGVFIFDSTYLAYSKMEVKAAGYLPKVVPLGNDLLVGVNEIGLEQIKAGETITLNNVLFHRGTPELVHGSEQELDLVVEMMNDNPTIKILLKGHTDNTGDPVKNVQLSEQRVKSVKKYLVSQGISPYRITGRGYGGNQPIASNETEETRKLNRRVEFEVVED